MLNELGAFVETAFIELCLYLNLQLIEVLFKV